jgi:hypothetical protein
MLRAGDSGKGRRTSDATAVVGAVLVTGYLPAARGAKPGCDPHKIEAMPLFVSYSGLAVVPQGPQRVDPHGAESGNRAGRQADH